jgi:hypothetical protein
MSLEPILIDSIPLRLDVVALCERLHVRDRAHQREMFGALAAEAEAIGRPKACLRALEVRERTADEVVLEDTSFHSRVLAVNVGEAKQVYVYVATCGRELAEWAQQKDDLLERFWAECLCEATLPPVLRAIESRLATEFEVRHSLRMSPGSLADWPLREQRPLFKVLGDAPQRIGVELTPGLMMTPAKSTSGWIMPSEATFESCMLCTREDCPNRRAPHDPGLYEAKYALM